jgi:DNA repair photolyase
MMLEGKYHLTRAIVQILLAHGVPCILSTKSNAPAFFEDIGLFQKFGEKLVLCIGQTNLAHLQQTNDPRALPNIRTANELVRLGLQTWVFITPVLPGITDVNKMIDALPGDTPVFLDKLRIHPEGALSRRFFAFVDAYDPSLKSRYQNLMQTGDDPYYQELKELYQYDSRVKFVFGEE